MMKGEQVLLKGSEPTASRQLTGKLTDVKGGGNLFLFGEEIYCLLIKVQLPSLFTPTINISDSMNFPCGTYSQAQFIA